MNSSGIHWLLETKGQETDDVARKEIAANLWCENATKLSTSTWKYVKVPQKDFAACNLPDWRISPSYNPSRRAHVKYGAACTQ